MPTGKFEPHALSGGIVVHQLLDRSFVGVTQRERRPLRFASGYEQVLPATTTMLPPGPEAVACQSPEMAQSV